MCGLWNLFLDPRTDSESLLDDNLRTRIKTRILLLSEYIILGTYRNSDTRYSDTRYP